MAGDIRQMLKKLFLILILCSVCLGVSPTITNFNTGQVSPLMEARVDFQKYNSSSRTIENMLVAVQGPVFRRPGTKYIASQKTSSAAGRVVAYEHTVDDNYVLLFENEVLRFFRNGGQILDSVGTEDISTLNNVVAHWLLNEDLGTTVVNDDEGTHNGTATVSTATLAATGKVGAGCFDLDVQYAVAMTDHNDFSFDDSGANPFSIACWAYITDSITSIIQNLVSKWKEGTAREWRFSLNEDRKLQLHLCDDSVSVSGGISHYKLNDDANNQAVDDDVELQDGVATDGTDDLTATGKIGKCLDFGGTDAVEINNQATYSFGDDTDDSPFSIATWIYVEAGTTVQSILAKWDETSGSELREWELYISGREELALILFDESANAYGRRNTDDALSAGWHFVVATYDGVGGTDADDGITLYVDSVAVSTTGSGVGTYAAMEDSVTKVTIGARYGTGGSLGQYYKNKIDNVAIFDEELSQAAVTNLWNNGDGSETFATVFPSAVSDDVIGIGWHFLCATYTGAGGATAASGIILYVDGEAVDSTKTNEPSYVAMENTGTTPKIGCQESAAAANEKFWEDKIDEVSIFSDVLTPNEVASLYSTTPYEINTPYLTADLFELYFKKSEDVMYIAHPDYEPRELLRAGHSLWTIAALGIATGPFQVKNADTSLTITPSATTGTITLTASDDLFVSDHIGALWQVSQKRGTSVYKGVIDTDESSSSTAYFVGGYSFTTVGSSWVGTLTLERSTDSGANWEAALTALTNLDFDNPAETEEDGAIYRVTGSSFSSGSTEYTLTITDQFNRGVVRIAGVDSSTVAVATVLTDLEDTSATSRWREGYWSDYRGWPQTVTVHQQRLIFGGSESFPQTIWFGKTDPDDYTNFTEGTLATSSFTIALAGENPIEWLLSQDYLFIGTAGSCGKYGEQGQAVTPTSPIYQEQTRHGSASIRAVLAGDTVLYIERGARKAREFSYSLQFDKYQSPDLNVLSPDITDSGIKDIAFQLRPNPVLWCVLNDGEIATLTYQRDQSVYAWTKQITDGDFESITVVSGDGEDEVWVTVERTIDSNPVRYVEQFQPVDWGSDPNDAWFVDSGLSYNDTEANSFSGLDHLIGEDVSIYADLLIDANEVVDANGEITIDNLATRVLAGMPYTSKLETLPLVVDPQDRIANKKIRRVGLDLYETGYLQYGNGANATLENINFENNLIADPNAEAQDFYTSVTKPKICYWPYGSMKKQTIYIESNMPMPLTIRAITPEYDVYP